MQKIIDNGREGHEWLLIIIVLCSLLTFKKIKKLEDFKARLKDNFKYFDF
ncbi:hypothetical protein [Metabacillus malikii]|uniref:Flagellin Flp1-like domain-containing protein n=1 Tax=Metabacillus malikii TaxID=1504265 RepID=A0ABT9ZBE6_9BACI|nr:hypothetical protein [Metabacillus malikii]MDQ0229131.1 hypothetical protein [Metabacillus malikii]